MHTKRVTSPGKGQARFLSVEVEFFHDIKLAEEQFLFSSESIWGVMNLSIDHTVTVHFFKLLYNYRNDIIHIAYHLFNSSIPFPAS